MKCREFVDFLMAYLDEELDPDRRALFESHIKQCPPCVHFLDSYKETVRLGQAVCRDEDAEGELPPDVPDELVQAILAATRKQG
jgi:anti-sigma factor RsiW